MKHYQSAASCPTYPLNVIVSENFRLPRFGFLTVGEDEQLEDWSRGRADNLLQYGVEGLDA